MVAQTERLHTRSMDDRRVEPRYLVKENAFVWDLHRMREGYQSVSIVDVSRNGMRLESASELRRGSHIAIDFRGMIICATVQNCRLVETRFATGVRINDVLDPLGEASDGDVASGESHVEVAAMV